MRTPFWHKIAFRAASVMALAAVERLRQLADRGPSAYDAPPENGEARTRMVGTDFRAHPRCGRRGAGSVISQASGAAKVQFQTDVQSGALYLVFANQSGRRLSRWTARARSSSSEAWRTGASSRRRSSCRTAPGTYVRLFPEGDRTLMDVYLFGEPFQTAGPASRHVRPVCSPRRFSSVMEWSAPVVNWPLVLAPSPGPGDRRIEEIVHVLHAAAPRASRHGRRRHGRHRAAGAHRIGRPGGEGRVQLLGFAKWVVDALYAPLDRKAHGHCAAEVAQCGAGQHAGARASRRSWIRFRPGLEQGSCPHHRRRHRPALTPSDDQIDVRDSDRLPYVPDVGYPVPKLEYLLYFLTRGRTPARSTSDRSTRRPLLAVSEGTPTLRQHHHVIVLFPYFDARGVFQVAVMERNARTSLASLHRRYGKEYVHLDEDRLATGELRRRRELNNAPLAEYHFS